MRSHEKRVIRFNDIQTLICCRLQVAKEMLIVNPKAGLILSTGAGSEIQFYSAGLYGESGRSNYTRVDDLFDVEV